MAPDADALRAKLAETLGDRLELGPLLGSGGFATVFRARDPFLERDVAIKVLDPGLGVSATTEEQFLREARIVAGVEHPHIVPLYAAESRNGLLYLVMRLLPGRTLADRIALGPLPAAEAARLAHEIAQALATAHACGVVHRDIKPENILLDATGHAIVTDFGISVVTAHSSTELPGATTGTPRYLSPEQALGEEADGRADVYSLGVVLYEMLTGRPPFDGRTLAELIAKHVAAPPPPLARVDGRLPAALVALTERMLAKDPGERPSSDELVELLAAARTPDALLTPRMVRWRRWRRRLVLLGVSAVSAGLVLYLGVRVIVFVTGAASSGDPPALDATGAAIPAELLAASRGEGSLGPSDTVRYAFIPAGRDLTDAVLFTDSLVIRRTADGPRVMRLTGSEIDVHTTSYEGTRRDFLILKAPGSPPDTIYDDLGGVELMRLGTALRSLAEGIASRR